MVKIQVFGKTATVHEYVWQTDWEPLLDVLQGFIPPDGSSPSDPHPDFTVAKKVVETFGGEILEADPVEYVHGRVY